MLAEDEGSPPRRAGLLPVGVGKEGAFVGNPVNVGRLVAHHALVVGGEIPVPDIIAEDHEHVWSGLLSVCHEFAS